MKGKLVPTTFGQTTDMVGGRLQVVRRAIECEIVGIYDNFVLCEFAAPYGVKLREGYCKTDVKLWETVWR